MEPGDWLHALPISNCGLRLDDETIRIAVGLCLGTNLCQSHTCPCGAQVDARGIQGALVQKKLWSSCPPPPHQRPDLPRSC